MPPKAAIISGQLREICKLSGARWAVFLNHTPDGWSFGIQHGVAKTRQAILFEFIRDNKAATWLAGTLSSGRTRSRSTGSFASSLGCQRLYVFPNLESRCALLVGADQLEKSAEGYYRAFVLGAPDEDEINEAAEENSPDLVRQSLVLPSLVEPELEYTDNPEEVLGNVLAALVTSVQCDWALMSIRSGDILHVEAVNHGPTTLHGVDFALRENKILAEMVERREGLILSDLSKELDLSRQAEYSGMKSWMGVPIVIGQRVIGHLEFVSKKEDIYDMGDLQRLSFQADRLAYVVENAIVFAEAARYLQQLALLNELASAASLGPDVHEVALRVLERLRRIFRTNLARVLLLSQDEKRLQEYGSPDQSSVGSVELNYSFANQVIKSGLPLREIDLNNPLQEVFIRHDQEGVRSLLAVPLKYRSKVIGVLALESEASNAFSAQDEQLLVLIASHLAGLFENMRLNEEARQRARQLQDTVRQLQAVRETALDIAGDLDLETILKRVVHRVCELVGVQGAELGLIDELNQVVNIHVSETPWQWYHDKTIPFMAGVAGSVAAFGEPLVVHDYHTWNGRLHPERAAPFRTASGVPLKFQGQVIGTLVLMDSRPDWVFTEEHLQLLQLLAPQVTVWIRNARLYQELQERIQAQKTAENHLIRSARLAAVGELAAGVAHELNNPLTTVSGFVELVLDELPADSVHRQDLELVLKESQRARGVVHRLLDFSRPVENQRASTDLNELVQDSLALIHHLAHTGGVEIRLELAKTLPWVSVDPSQIKQVFLNLGHNAIQAMPNGGIMRVKTGQVCRDGREWAFASVRDNGVGISSENLERIFEPFFTTRPAGSGTGLGLSVSYGIVNEHAGSIEVESQPGKGSCFTVYLPLLNEDMDG
jgi:two-component system NtrC family sensor kinase